MLQMAALRLATYASHFVRAYLVFAIALHGQTGPTKAN
jgi:hypothetical protein